MSDLTATRCRGTISSEQTKNFVVGRKKILYIDNIESVIDMRANLCVAGWGFFLYSTDASHNYTQPLLNSVAIINKMQKVRLSAKFTQETKIQKY